MGTEVVVICVFKSALICSNSPYIHEFSPDSQHIVSSVIEVNTIARAQRGDIHDSQANVNSPANVANPASYAGYEHCHARTVICMAWGAGSIAGLRP